MGQLYKVIIEHYSHNNYFTTNIDFEIGLYNFKIYNVFEIIHESVIDIILIFLFYF